MAGGNDQFLCQFDDFGRWADARRGRMVMEDFFRWHRRWLGVLMDSDETAGGRWDLEADNREPPHRGGRGMAPPTPRPSRRPRP